MHHRHIYVCVAHYYNVPDAILTDGESDHFNGYWNEYEKLVATVRTNTDVPVAANDRVIVSRLVQDWDEIDADLSSLFHFINFRKWVLENGDEGREALTEYWNDVEEGDVVINTRPSGAVARRIWDAGLDEVTLNRLITMSNDIRYEIRETDFTTLIKNINIVVAR